MRHGTRYTGHIFRRLVPLKFCMGSYFSCLHQCTKLKASHPVPSPSLFPHTLPPCSFEHSHVMMFLDPTFLTGRQTCVSHRKGAEQIITTCSQLTKHARVCIRKICMFLQGFLASFMATELLMILFVSEVKVASAVLVALGNLLLERYNKYILMTPPLAPALPPRPLWV